MWRRSLNLILLLCAVILSGCGTTRQNTATEQMLGADAVDRAISQLDFSRFAGQKVFFNSEYIKTYPGKNYQGIGYANAEYVISSFRQQIASAGCLLQDKAEDAEIIIEGRIGVLGQDINEIVYGLPANNALAAVSAALPTAPPLPTIPEISVARRKDQMSAVKVAAFAYHRESRHPVWQSGLALGRSIVHDSWVLGAGPFESGTIPKRWREERGLVKLPIPIGENLESTPEYAAYSQPREFEWPKSVSTPSKNSVTQNQDTRQSSGPSPQVAGSATANQAKNTP
jgi:hypothetical protein